MTLRVKIKPFIIKEFTKERLISKISFLRSNPVLADRDINNCLIDEKFFYLYSIQKFNKKTEQLFDKNKKKFSNIINNKYWEAHVYKIPIKMIEENKLRVEQFDKTFIIKNK